METLMKWKLALAAILAVSLPALGRLALAQGAANLDTAAIEEATGLKGQLIPEESVFKVTKPRTDVKITVDQFAMPPFMGLASWAAFTPAHMASHAMMMGDTVVFEDEVNPAMSAAFDAGLEVTALHNHFFFDEPKVYFMHIGGHGDVKALAGGVSKVYDKIAEIRAANPMPVEAFPAPSPRRAPSPPPLLKRPSASKASPIRACSRSSSAAAQ
jgi:hypothetical protein